MDSKKFAKGAFRPHGNSSIHLEANIFRMETVGPFNREAVQAINATRDHLLTKDPPSGKYAFINCWSGSLLMPLDAVDEYHRGVMSAYLNRFVPPSAMAWVVPTEVEGRSLMRPYFERIFADAKIPFEMFHDVESAEAWVGELLKR